MMLRPRAFLSVIVPAVARPEIDAADENEFSRKHEN
jgi:hypothetical protein